MKANPEIDREAHNKSQPAVIREKEILYAICVSIGATLDAIKYAKIDPDESITKRNKAEKEIMKAIDLIKALPSE
jgi:hypothetical protein